jgi:phosphomannomutase
MSKLEPKIKFGTDGWRGVISEDFTFRNVRRVAQAIADYYNRQTGKQANRQTKIAVGYDTRFLSDRYAKEVSQALAKNGIDVILSDRAIPTPMLSFAVKNKKLTSGVMITASHNPAEYNGIKIKTSSGAAAGLEVTDEIEKLLSHASCLIHHTLGRIKEEDLTGDYISFLKSYIDLRRFKNAKFKVLVDPMYGSGNGFIADILKGTKIKLEFMRSDVNPSFAGIRPEPVLENLRPTLERLKKEKFDLCLVLDGDADRIACFAGRGVFISPQKILGLLTLHLSQDRKMSGGVVKTIVGTTLIDKITQQLNLRLFETPVGFKYISALMEKENVLVGGEEAGGIGFKGYIPERDGTLAGLLLLEMMIYRNKTMLEILNEMEDRFGRYYYLREDLELQAPCLSLPRRQAGGRQASSKLQDLKNLKKILGKEVVEVKDYDGIKLICSDESWLMFRASGTEPLIRVYAESGDLKRSEKLIEFGKGLIL